MSRSGPTRVNEEPGRERAHAPIPDELVTQILEAKNSETHAALAQRLGIGLSTVRRYRGKHSAERQEAAREAIAEHVAEHVPHALDDLTELRKLAAAEYRDTGDAKQGNLWLRAIETTLSHVRPDDSTIDAAIRAELDALAHAGQAPPPGEPPGAPTLH